jgi:hypothetical protein
MGDAKRRQERQQMRGAALPLSPDDILEAVLSVQPLPEAPAIGVDHVWRNLNILMRRSAGQ